MGVHVYLELVFSFSSDKYLEVDLMDHMIVVFWVLKEPPYCFPQWLHQFTFSQQCMRVPFSPHLRIFLVFLVIAILIGYPEHWEEEDFKTKHGLHGEMCDDWLAMSAVAEEWGSGSASTDLDQCCSKCDLQMDAGLQIFRYPWGNEYRNGQQAYRNFYRNLTLQPHLSM